MAEFFDIVIVCGGPGSTAAYRPINSTVRLSTRKSCVAPVLRQSGAWSWAAAPRSHSFPFGSRL